MLRIIDVADKNSGEFLKAFGFGRSDEGAKRVIKDIEKMFADIVNMSEDSYWEAASHFIVQPLSSLKL